MATDIGWKDLYVYFYLELRFILVFDCFFVHVLNVSLHDGFFFYNNLYC